MKRIAGVTLLEILVGIGITSVLAYLSIPGYRKLLLRAKTKEAVQNLGALWASENAFRAATGQFGNNLTGLGYDFNPLERNAIRYTVGFPGTTGNCVNDAKNVVPATSLTIRVNPEKPTIEFLATNGGEAKAIPTDAGDFQTLETARPEYFAGPVNTLLGRPYLQGETVGKCYPGSVDKSGLSYVASATGCLLPDCKIDSPTTLPSSAKVVQDVWTIDQNRLVRNVTDGR